MKKNNWDILLVEDEEDLARGLCKILSSAGYEVQRAKDGLEAIEKAKQYVPDLILLDIMLPKMDGREVKDHLEADPVLANVPVIFLTAKGKVEDKVEGLRHAEDYVTKPFETPELLARLESVLKRQERFHEASMTDPLTGLGNSRLFDSQLETLFHIAKRYKRIFSLAVMDIDNLKKINDEYGHITGSEAIKKVADVMREVFRKADILVRYGGDEYVVIFPECQYDQARAAIERFHQLLAKEKIPSTDPQKNIVVSVGLVTFSDDLESPLELFSKADRLMYENKKNGRKKIRKNRQEEGFQ